ncbi:lipoate--protein ligase family protein [Paenibacillus sp. LMG 31456]|uniref:Lipoate--protein ligase family protein n=1 Tax=Paenibacillus foliorum TaxID=2654974 RepID=A0A972H042_9BACL|nr:lipoate--protein ligase family protein [Paenibacillus foliorum]NOU96105.1 lipoate--protein ligase family protein [Paenibacillus foliorum]
MKAEQWSLPGGMLIWDRTQQIEHEEVLVPFALDELLCRQVGEGGAPIIHMWRHPRALVMGLRDSRLPHALKAKQWLEAQGYSVAVRNSGGAAVPLDLGVVNISLVMPKRQGQIDYRHDFETMYSLIKDTLQALSPDVEKGEIKGSYCPGDYDLSIGGRKFCGIAQRRQAHAIVVQAFVVVRGDGASQATLAREFYRIAAEGADGQCFPKVAEHSMASLEELIGLADEQRFVDSVKQTVRERKLTAAADAGPLSLPDEQQIAETVAMLKARYGIA